jgi:UDPglucose--hexose-1-phosphate uridylyltransferase
MTISSVIKTFVQTIIERTDYEMLDETYLRNQVMALIGEKDWDDQATPDAIAVLDALDILIERGVTNQVITDSTGERDVLSAQLMDFFAPRPSEINRRFWQLYQTSPRDATDDFYALSQQTNYIKTREISQNISYQAPTDYGDIDITINLAKPEKTLADIAAAREAPQTNYPACQLCMSNEGLRGHAQFAGRTNHRIVRVSLGGETWGLQYSPYSYFNEHAIVLAPEHRPMRIDATNLGRLFDFVDQFPDYFIGSNADLPIVGGSILTHDHFQAGRYEMPMAKAPIVTPITVGDFDLQEAGVLKWPMTVIRLRDKRRETVQAAAYHILTRWRVYSDEQRDILAESADGTPHHTITPIVRKRGDLYEMDVVLRDNHTSEQYPEGVFHPHPDVQHIKQENIGLIEVMGVAVLPPRLKTELADISQYLVDGMTPVADKHADWAHTLRKQHPQLDVQDAQALIKQAVAEKFVRVLEDAGVYKQTTDGQRGLQAFLSTLKT